MAKLKSPAVKCAGCGFVQKNGPETTSGKCLDCDRLSPSTGNHLKGDFMVAPNLPTIPASETGLYWGEQGMINCIQHAPIYLSDAWRGERWAPLTYEDIGRLSFKAECEVCGRVAP
jgi:hypothetical protein